MKYLFIAAIVFLTAVSCDLTPPEQKILGAWKVDSTYSYYNGFDMMERKNGADWAVLLYEIDQTVKEIKYGTYQEHHYDFIGPDSLVFLTANGQIRSSYSILRLDERQLHLLKNKAPIFAGKQQQRYEIRYYSRTKAPEETKAFETLN